MLTRKLDKIKTHKKRLIIKGISENQALRLFLPCSVSKNMWRCVFTSWSLFCRCFCLRCWHSNTNYTWNITPTYKTHYYPTWGGILADVCSALLFPFTHSPRRHRWATLALRLLRCLSLGNPAVCLVLSIYLSAPLIACDIYFIYTFQYSGLSATGSFHTAEPWSPSFKEIID